MQRFQSRLHTQKKWDYVVLTADPEHARPWDGYNLSKLLYDKHYAAYYESRAVFAFFRKLRSFYCVLCESSSAASLRQVTNTNPLNISGR